MDSDDDLIAVHTYVYIAQKHSVMARVGGNPESTLRFLTHVVSDLAHAEPNKTNNLNSEQLRF